MTGVPVAGPELGPAGRWVWSRLFPGQREQIEQARAFVGSVVGSCPCRGLAQLLVSELASNAIQHTRSGELDGWFVVHVVAFPHGVRLCVFDLGHPYNAPSIQVVRVNAETGRGLLLVDAFATNWGVEGGASGHTVWADITCPLATANERATKRPAGTTMSTEAVKAIQKALGTRVRARRVELGLSQEALAKRTDKHWSYVGRLERGHTNPTLSTLLTVSHALEIKLADLLKGLRLPSNDEPS